MDELIDELKDKLENIHYRMPENAWEKFKHAEQLNHPVTLPDSEEVDPFPAPGFWASRIGKIIKLSLTSLSAAASVAITVYVSVPKKHADKPVPVSVAPHSQTVPKRTDLVRPKNVETLKMTPPVMVQPLLIVERRQLSPVKITSPEIAAPPVVFTINLQESNKTISMRTLQISIRLKNEILYGQGLENNAFTLSGDPQWMQSSPKSGYGNDLQTGYRLGNQRIENPNVAGAGRVTIGNPVRSVNMSLPINNSLTLQSDRSSLNTEIGSSTSRIEVQNTIPSRNVSTGAETAVNSAQENRPIESPPRTVDGAGTTPVASETERTEAIRNGSATINAPSKGNKDKLLNLKYYNFSIEFQQKLKSKKSIGVAPFLQVPASGFSDTRYLQYNRYGVKISLSF